MCVRHAHVLDISAFESAHVDPLVSSHLVPTNAAPEASANATFIIDWAAEKSGGRVDVGVSLPAVVTPTTTQHASKRG